LGFAATTRVLALCALQDRVRPAVELGIAAQTEQEIGPRIVDGQRHEFRVGEMTVTAQQKIKAGACPSFIFKDFAADGRGEYAVAYSRC
ncbi:hypothetical protein ACS8Y6_05730, partial [Salinisphaera sp. RV14]|uniref:hypothetical protein n=1 Tax=Salinisphaera sp. RV14 TaxID=3454140 RepID=UPI003F825FD6